MTAINCSVGHAHSACGSRRYLGGLSKRAGTHTASIKPIDAMNTAYANRRGHVGRVTIRRKPSHAEKPLPDASNTTRSGATHSSATRSAAN